MGSALSLYVCEFSEMVQTHYNAEQKTVKPILNKRKIISKQWHLNGLTGTAKRQHAMLFSRMSRPMLCSSWKQKTKTKNRNLNGLKKNIDAIFSCLPVSCQIPALALLPDTHQYGMCVPRHNGRSELLPVLISTLSYPILLYVLWEFSYTAHRTYT